MSRKNINIEVQVRGQVDVPDEVQIAIFRIAQEALNNLVKHSGATHAKIMLTRDDQAVTLMISDDGCGFDASCEFAGHLGLKIMHERANSIDAVLEINSTPGKGTQLGIIWRLT